MDLLQARMQGLEQRLSALEAAAAPLSPEAALCLRQLCLNARAEALLRAVGAGSDEEPAPIASSSTRAAAHAQQEQQPPASPTQQRLHDELLQRGFSRVRFVRVPAEYYDRPLEFRQAQLGAASIAHLCKTILMENTRAHPSVIDPADPLSPANWANPRNSRYYLVIVQYAARLNADKIKKLVHGWSGGQLGKQYFNMRLAPEEVSDALSGYTHNAVTPVGMRVQLPMIMSHHIAQLQPDTLFFLGAGEVDLKVGIYAKEFVASYAPFVEDITY